MICNMLDRRSQQTKCIIRPDVWLDHLYFRPNVVRPNVPLDHMYRRPNEIRPNEVRPNEIRPNEIRPNVATPSSGRLCLIS